MINFILWRRYIDGAALGVAFIDLSTFLSEIWLLLYFRGPKPPSLSVNGITDILEEEMDQPHHNYDRGPIDIVMMPPMERRGEDSGSDSDDEDMPEATINRLPRKMLETGKHSFIHSFIHSRSRITQ